jgi:hypothetical protein
MITIDVQPGNAGKAKVSAAPTYSALRIADQGHTVTVFFEPDAAEKLRAAAKLINEAFAVGAIDPASREAAE